MTRVCEKCESKGNTNNSTYINYDWNFSIYTERQEKLTQDSVTEQIDLLVACAEGFINNLN